MSHIGPMYVPMPGERCPVCGGEVDRSDLKGWCRIYCAPRCASRATTRRHRGQCISDRFHPVGAR